MNHVWVDATLQWEVWTHMCQPLNLTLLRRERLHRRIDCHGPETDMEQRQNLWTLKGRCWRRSLKRLLPLMSKACQCLEGAQTHDVQCHANAHRQGS